MEDKRKNNGGNKNAGRKSKADEDKAKTLIRKALKKLYKKDADDDNTVLFLHEFAQTPKGQQFIAEHLLGKPKETIDNNVSVTSIEPIKWVE